MTRQEFVSAVLQNAMTVQGYKVGCDGRGVDHLCDCIGLIIGAFEILGVKWPGVHGTNWTARNYVKGLSEFGTTLDLQIGDVVFKAREPGQDGYNLPDTYKNSPDKRDYYHIGVVTNLNPFKITHCTTVPGGIQADQGKKNWKFKAVLEPIAEGGHGMKKGLVMAESGNTVNMRQSSSTSAPVIVQVKIGEEVDVIEEQGEWDKIEYSGYTGYMMSKFIVIVADDTPPDEPIEPEPGEDFVTIKLPIDLAVELWEALDNAIGKG